MSGIPRLGVECPLDWRGSEFAPSPAGGGLGWGRGARQSALYVRGPPSPHSPNGGRSNTPPQRTSESCSATNSCASFAPSPAGGASHHDDQERLQSKDKSLSIEDTRESNRKTLRRLRRETNTWAPWKPWIALFLWNLIDNKRKVWLELVREANKKFLAENDGTFDDRRHARTNWRSWLPR